jgi:hypothetical protein
MLATIFWVLFWTLIWPVGAWAIDRLVNPRTPERRVERLLRWYPPAWRARHGAAMGELLHDAIADGRDGPRLTLDVAREGAIEGCRGLRGDSLKAGGLIGAGCVMLFPQGLVAAILIQFDVPPSWFLALHVDGEAQYVVAGTMTAIGVLLIERGIHLAGRAGRTLRCSASG